MDAPPSPDDAAPPSVRPDTERFDRSLRRLLGEEQQSGLQILFFGGTREDHQNALARLTRYVTGTVHQVGVPVLLDEQRVQTQNNVRKAFDHAAEEHAVLYLDRVDAAFEHEHADDPTDESDLTLSEYMIDRITAYDGVTVLGLPETSAHDQARAFADLVVQFE